MGRLLKRRGLPALFWGRLLVRGSCGGDLGKGGGGLQGVYVEGEGAVGLGEWIALLGGWGCEGGAEDGEAE